MITRGRTVTTCPTPCPGPPTVPLDLVSHRAAARSCGVGPRTIRRWIATGAWPLPRAVCGTTLYFEPSGVDGWLRAGAWPMGARFRRRGAGRVGGGHDR